MEHSTFLKSPKKEQKEEEEENEGHTSGCISKPHSIEDEVIMDDELEGILGIEDIETNPSDVVARGIDSRNYLQVNWEDEFSTAHLFQDPEFWHLNGDEFGVKSESRCEHWDFDDRKASLHLNLNYEEVLEAWSNRGSLWAPSNSYNGEVPVMDEERGVWSRRQASVMRYKEKRQSRLFSKKIRYEVRKLNADKRPRIKGRFVKRLDDKMQNGS